MEGKAVSLAAPDNGMHPTANNAAFIENLPLVAARRGGLCRAFGARAAYTKLDKRSYLF